eukprot:1194520-Prorocentrum_minimum.AAC.3
MCVLCARTAAVRPLTGLARVVVRLPKGYTTSGDGLRAELHEISYGELLTSVKLLKRALQPHVSASTRQEVDKEPSALGDEAETDLCTIPIVGVYMGISGTDMVHNTSSFACT